LICEFPKISPVAAAMRMRMAQIWDRCGPRQRKGDNVERLGFTGRSEGSAMAGHALIKEDRMKQRAKITATVLRRLHETCAGTAWGRWPPCRWRG
jgi:hypothetical protein